MLFAFRLDTITGENSHVSSFLSAFRKHISTTEMFWISIIVVFWISWLSDCFSLITYYPSYISKVSHCWASRQTGWNGMYRMSHRCSCSLPELAEFVLCHHNWLSVVRKDGGRHNYRSLCWPFEVASHLPFSIEIKSLNLPDVYSHLPFSCMNAREDRLMLSSLSLPLNKLNLQVWLMSSWLQILLAWVRFVMWVFFLLWPSCLPWLMNTILPVLFIDDNFFRSAQFWLPQIAFEGDK